MMYWNRIQGLFFMLTLALNALAQGEELRALSTRPIADGGRPKDNVRRVFEYQYEMQDIPLMDDFSVDRTRKRIAREGDPDVTPGATLYRLTVNGESRWDMRYATDTTFHITVDTSDPPVTTRQALPSVQVTVRNLDVYPPTTTNVVAWPAYDLLDSVGSPPMDTIHLLSPALIQDSLLVFNVAPVAGTYMMNDVATPLVLWQDDDVYVNGTYGIDPPTIGVATFDGLARTGYPYDFANYSAYGRADHLTSVPIDLEYPVADSIYLSFFYQARGLSGDAIPQSVDSLILEFYAPLENSWYKQWAIPYVDPAAFQQVLIPVRQERFLKEGFQFRFVNCATLSGSFDHWHLDYVRLGAQRSHTDTRLVDVAYMYPEASILQTYTSVPFGRFQDAPASMMALQVVEKMRNLDIMPAFITYGMTAVSEDGGPVSTFTNGLSPSGNAAMIIDTDHPINSAPNNFVFDNSSSTDAAFWDVKFWCNATPDINRYNDTIHLRQELSNYYAYDDGTAEMGYGLNVAGGKLAYRYDLIGADSLRAVRMYFNPIANQPPLQHPSDGSFLLTVWTSLDPEVIQHQNFSFSSPEYRLDGIDKFVEYPLDSAISVQGSIYIGWVQTNGANMNLGFDRNRDNSNRIFYKTSGSFTNTSFDGSLMMRPVMVSAVDPWASVEEHRSAPGGLLIHPNPTTDMVRIAMTTEMPTRATVQCLDATGRVVWSQRMTASETYSMAGMANGLYVIRVVDADGGVLAQGRSMVQH